jgi:hypothetical protein
MSRTYSLVCPETRQKIWVGQAHIEDGREAGMTSFYSGVPETMERLGRFLQATRGKQLVLLCDDDNYNSDERGEEFIEYEEFEDPPG